MVCECVSNAPLFYNPEAPTTPTKCVLCTLTVLNQCSRLQTKMLNVFPHGQG